MNGQDPIVDDPVVREVRDIRKAMWHEAGCTTEGYLRLIETLSHAAIQRRGLGTHEQSRPTTDTAQTSKSRT